MKSNFPPLFEGRGLRNFFPGPICGSPSSLNDAQLACIVLASADLKDQTVALLELNVRIPAISERAVQLSRIPSNLACFTGYTHLLKKLTERAALHICEGKTRDEIAPLLQEIVFADTPSASALHTS
jgi:hypothetical protein